MRFPLLTIVLLTMCGLATGGTALARQSAWTTESLLDHRDAWDRLVDLPLEIEGRITLLSSTSLRLAKLPIPCEFEESLRRFLNNRAHVRLSGRLHKDSDTGKFKFVVSAVKVLPSDVEAFRTRAGELRAEDGAGWYALADWAKARGDFFNDEALLELSQTAIQKGVSAEYREIPLTEADPLLKLAEKVHDLKLPERLVLEYRHEAAVRAWRAAARGEGAATALRKVEEQIQATLPGSRETPLDPASLAQQRMTYLSDPVTAYRDAGDRDRKIDAWWLYRAVEASEMKARLAEDGSNGAVLFAEWQERLGNEPGSEAMLDRYDDFRRTRVTTSTRPELLSWLESLRKRGKNELAGTMALQWMSSREALYRDQGAEGVVRTADDLVHVLNDKPQAISTLRTGWQKYTGDVRISQQFSNMGYQLKEGRWLDSSGIPVTDDMPKDSRKVAPSGLQAGMTMTAARQLMGQPQSRTRMASLGTITEFWSYGDRGSRLVLQFTCAPSREGILTTFFNDEVH